MTFSVVGRDGASYGVAVASKFLVGRRRRARGLGRHRRRSPPRPGQTSPTAPRPGALLADGPRRPRRRWPPSSRPTRSRRSRQAGVVVPPAAATYTGADCLAWAGGDRGRRRRRAGQHPDRPRGRRRDARRLARPVRASGWPSGCSPCCWRATRPVATAAAGSRPRCSSPRPAAGYGGHDIEVDLRVDDHPEPVPELARLLDLHRLYFDAADEATPAAARGRAGRRGARRCWPRPGTAAPPSTQLSTPGPASRTSRSACGRAGSTR